MTYIDLDPHQSMHAPHEADEGATSDLGKGGPALKGHGLKRGLGVDAAREVAGRCWAASQPAQQSVDECIKSRFEWSSWMGGGRHAAHAQIKGVGW